MCIKKIVWSSDVNDAEPRLLFSEKKTSPIRIETLAKQARAKPRP